MLGRAGKDLVESTSRTNTAAWLDFKQDKTVARLEEILAEVTGTDPEFGENLQILHYEPTQEFKEHHDYFDPATDPPENFVPGGNRLATAIVYLDVAAQGGETLFTRIDKRVKPQPGDALLFYDLTPEGTVDIQTMHAGQQPIGGEKWCAAASGRSSRAPLTNLPRAAAAAGRCDPRDVCAWGPSVGWAAPLDALQICAGQGGDQVDPPGEVPGREEAGPGRAAEEQVAAVSPKVKDQRGVLYHHGRRRECGRWRRR